ncbi:calcium homeostasis modulator protein 6-like%2C partial [Xyrichtys novacula]|uniref:Calcium homeostasis modulator protein 6-like, partial n=1 Tax=Xyrichtys novacula TaxID=13765 RepID=A0AAV1FMP8_XYRNO|nr:calcium homeostasis modulator protein 6-like%2C partial [Xyrichtys novacula]
MDSYTVEHAKELAERNVESFFTMMPPENIKTPSNRDWEKISSLYTFSSRKQYYSTLHRHVESWQEDGRGMMRIASVKSTNSAAVNPAVLSFVDDGNITL